VACLADPRQACLVQYPEGAFRDPGGNPRPEQRRGQEPAFYLGVAGVDVDAELAE